GNKVYDSGTREHLRGVLPIDPGIYQLYVLFANFTSMQLRLRETSGSEACHVLMYGRPNDGDAIPDLQTLMTFDHYRIIMWRLQDKVIKRHNEGS
ncbi:MAG: hypothetical protein JWM11_2852, partial [Planctomycetaceae bacterium]|nr:hypothetical protein [Planctomycetaceae bacterium]